MRSFSFAGFLLLGLTACSQGDDKTKAGQEKEKPAEVKLLKAGDAAPMIKGAKYLTGKDVVSYEPGKVYVVEFWATWCGPCIQAMPHLAEIQSEYASKGLTVVGVTTKDPNNTFEKVTEFVEKKGKKYGYAFAYCEGEETYDAFMKAAGQDGIPCSFVVDKGGKIAYIGHPMELDDVLEKVVAGTWRGAADLEEIKKANEEIQSVMEKGQANPVVGLKLLEEFGQKYPGRAKQDVFAFRKILFLMQTKKFDEAKAASDELFKKANEKKSVGILVNLSAIWAAAELNPEKKHIGLATSAVDALVKIEGETDLNAMATAAEVYFAAGQKDKAIAFGEKAIKLADNPRLKAAVEEMVKKFKEEKK